MDTTANSSGSKRSGNFLAGLVSLDEFEKLIECPVCQDLPLPPIYNCQTGHVICSKCKVILKECPICKMPYTASRNFLWESIVQTSTYYCNHRDKGCNVIGNSQMLKNHLEECKFGPTKCFLAGRDGCKSETIFLSDYLSHLTDIHQVKRLTLFNKDIQNAFALGYYLNDWNNATLTTAYSSWCNTWLSFDDNIFVTRSFRRGSKFFFQLAVIAESVKTDEEKYLVKITIENDKFLKFELTSVVPSIKEFRDNGESWGEGEYGAVSKEFLEKVGELVPMEEYLKFKLTWNVRYELTKVL